MRRLVLALILLIGACSSPDATSPGETFPQAETTSVPASGNTETSTTTTLQTDPESPGETSFDELAADALVTPTGVVVAVLEQTLDGYLVRTPCDAVAVVTTGTPVGGISVVLDPGHGGPVDTGAVGPNGLAEAELNLTLARAVETRLRDRGVPVILTRTGNYPTSLGVRAALADHVDADILVSIHHNAPTQHPSASPGTEVYIQHDSSQSRRLGGLLWEHVVGALDRFDVEWSAANDAGVLTVLNSRGTDAYGMIRTPSSVSALIEMGYVSNRAEAELYATADYIEAASVALADAIEAYLSSDARGSGYVAEGRVFNPQPGISRSICEDPDLG